MPPRSRTRSVATGFSLEGIFQVMFDAAKNSLQQNVRSKWPKIRDLTTASIKDIAQNFIDIKELSDSGAITQEQAKLKISLQKNAFQTMLLTEKGIGLIIVEDALNSALNAVKKVVNTAVGFVLI
ncbi:MAG: hypothetical protein MUE58_07140 [Chitinophagaceae bacterium]|nr:hypothetical protein [Chitinophagaceae bacterium]